VAEKRFNRTKMLLGQEAFGALNSSKVAVAGLGAVGSYAVEGLVRSGVGNICVADFDEVKHSNINRQLYALESTVGRKKCDLARERILDINPDCNVEAKELFINADSLTELFNYKPDLIIDAIDSLGPKVALLAGAVDNNIPVLSSMGAAQRRDPLKITIGPLNKAYNCRLASHVRKKIRKLGVEPTFTCVYSTELVDKESLEETSKAVGVVDEHDYRWKGRKRDALGSLPTITGIFGLYLADEAIRVLCGDN
jgi:tRNA A37 threonylcarbamoyladenosine dehydratase